MERKSRRSFLGAAGAALGSVFGLQGFSAAVQAYSSPYGRPKLKITDIRTAEV